MWISRNIFLITNNYKDVHVLVLKYPACYWEWHYELCSKVKRNDKRKSICCCLYILPNSPIQKNNKKEDENQIFSSLIQQYSHSFPTRDRNWDTYAWIHIPVFSTICTWTNHHIVYSTIIYGYGYRENAHMMYDAF